MIAQMLIVAGLPAEAFQLPLGDGVFGRAPGSAVELEHVEVSRQHCRFTWDGSTLTVEDLETARGTTINGIRIDEPTVLQPGDELALGPVVLRFSLLTDARSERAAAVDERDAPPEMLVLGAPAERVEITSELTVGREDGCDVVLRDASVSRRHARFSVLPNGGCSVTDLQSAGGSFINGHRFDEHEFTVGDRLQIGPFVFQFDGRALFRVANSQGGAVRATGLHMRVTERSVLDRLTGRARTQTILDNVSLSVPPSRFFGLLGPSGAGKSSLLAVLAGLRKPDGGFVLVDGADVYANPEPPEFGFVPQDDIVHLELTVRQALHFAARLRLAANTPPHEIDRLLSQTMHQLGLSARAELPIWRLSGGQRKRVSVAVELLARPSILFLDEPTSGLDPATEFQLMSLLRDLADTGCTVIATTHVVENAYLIDQLVILVGGCLAFQGSAAEVREYFHVPKLTDLYDQLVQRTPAEWQSAFEERQAKALQADSAAPAVLKSAASNLPARTFPLPILLARQWAIFRSDWRNFLPLLGQPLIIGALVCWVSDERELVMFFAYLSTLYFGCSNAAPELVKEIAIYRRERLVGVGTHPYLGSKVAFISALTILQAFLLYIVLVFGEGGPDGSVLLQLAALTGTALAAVGIGCAISAVARNVTQAVSIVPVVLIPMIIFSGYVVKPTAMSDAVRRVSRATPAYAAQVVFDTSFIYQRPLVGELTEDYYQAIKNLGANEIENRTEDDRYIKLGPALRGLLVQLLWAVGAYWVAWFALRKRVCA